MIQRHPVRDAGTAIVPDDVEVFVAQFAHQLHLVAAIARNVKSALPVRESP